MGKQVQHESRQIFGAVYPLTGASVAMMRPRCGTEGMNASLAAMVEALEPGVQAVPVLDGAGGHRAMPLGTPASNTLHFLPPDAPELMPMQRVWLWMKSHHLSNRLLGDEAASEAACGESWSRLAPERLRRTAAGELGHAAGNAVAAGAGRHARESIVWRVRRGVPARWVSAPAADPSTAGHPRGRSAEQRLSCTLLRQPG